VTGRTPPHLCHRSEAISVSNRRSEIASLPSRRSETSPSSGLTETGSSRSSPRGTRRCRATHSLPPANLTPRIRHSTLPSHECLHGLFRNMPVPSITPIPFALKKPTRKSSPPKARPQNPSGAEATDGHHWSNHRLLPGRLRGVFHHGITEMAIPQSHNTKYHHITLPPYHHTPLLKHHKTTIPQNHDFTAPRSRGAAFPTRKAWVGSHPRPPIPWTVSGKDPHPVHPNPSGLRDPGTRRRPPGQQERAHGHPESPAASQPTRAEHTPVCAGGILSPPPGPSEWRTSSRQSCKVQCAMCSEQ
jgi:hypothetical protein